MAEFLTPNYLATMNAGYEQGNRIAEQNRALKQRNHLQQLAPQVIAGDPTAYDQAAAIDPDAATRYQQAGDASLVKMRNMVDYIDRARASGNQAAVSAALRVAGPYITKFTGKPAPIEWTPDMDAGWEALKAKVAMAGNPTPGGRVQSTYIDAQGNRVAIMADGSTQILGQNAPNNQIIDTGNGFYGVNKGNLQAAPVMIGSQPQQAQQAPSGFVQTPTGPVNIDPSLPPKVRAQIAANPDAFMGDGTMQAAPFVQDGPPPQTGGQLRSVPEPETAYAPLSQDEIKALGLPPGTVAQRNLSTGQVTTTYTPPAASTNGRVSQTQIRQANAAKQKLIDLQSVRNQLNLVRQKFAPLKNSFSAGLGGQFLPTVEGKQFDASVDLLRQFIRKLTRTPGEGSMSDWEGKIASLANPSRGDYEQVTQDKLDQLDALVSQLEQGYGAILQDNSPQQAEPSGGNVIRYDAQGNRIP